MRHSRVGSRDPDNTLPIYHSSPAQVSIDQHEFVLTNVPEVSSISPRGIGPESLPHLLLLEARNRREYSRIQSRNQKKKLPGSQARRIQRDCLSFP